MARRCVFFATQPDLLLVLEKVEAQRDICYVRAGLFDSEVLTRVYRARNIEQFGIALKGDQNHVPAYLIVDAKTNVKIEDVPQRRGGVKYAVDQLKNPKSIVFNPGGEFGSVAIIAGEVSTISRDSDSLSLFTLVSKQVKKEFTNIGGMYVSRNAIEAMDSGIRLTQSVTAPHECDLRRVSKPDSPSSPLTTRP